MIDLHTHTLLSDGLLLPFELAQRARARGYSAIAFTDHVDASNIATVVPAALSAARALRGSGSIDVLAGVEITHAPPSLIPGLIKEARELGAELVVVHGETIAEPVEPGTNRAAIEGGADLLAHPGLITDDDIKLAVERDVVLEITSRKGHSLSNGHVAKGAIRLGARLAINTDSHSPEDLITTETARAVLLSAGMDEAQADEAFQNAHALLQKALRRN